MCIPCASTSVETTTNDEIEPLSQFPRCVAVSAVGLEIMRHITLPLLKRVLMFVVVTQTIFSFQNFVPVYVMTKGGPMDSTKVIVFYIYQYGFLFQDMGYASAMSIVTLVVLLVISMIQMRLFKTDVEY